jgi:hypothetical protein
MAGLLSILAGTGINTLGDIGRTIVQQKMAESAQKRILGLKALLGGLTMETPEAQMASKAKLEELSGVSPWPTAVTTPQQQAESQIRLLSGLPMGAGRVSTPEQLATNRATLEAQTPRQRLAGLVPTSLEDLIISRLSPETTGEDIMGMRYKSSEMGDLLRYMALQGNLFKWSQEQGIARDRLELDKFHKAMLANMADTRNKISSRKAATDEEEGVRKQGMDLLDRANESKTWENAATYYRNYIALQKRYPDMLDPVVVPKKFQPWFYQRWLGAPTREEELGGGVAPVTKAPSAKPQPQGMPGGYEEEVAELNKLNLPEERKAFHLKRIMEKYGVR